MASESGYNPGLEEIADRAANRLAELTQQYCGEGRTCGTCNQFKAWDEFYKHPLGKNGRMANCKACRSNYYKDYNRGIKRAAPERPSTHKCRGKCGRELPLNEQHFYKNKANSLGFTLTCRKCECQLKRLLAALKATHPKADAGGRCFACNKETDDLVWDHDHDTDAFRGWACRSCNRRLCAPYSKSSSSK